MMLRFISGIFLLFLFSCSASRNYNPNKKFPPQELRQDYTLLRNILEEKHPSLYWYTSKERMNNIFDLGYKAIEDSMTELQFGWKILAPLTAAIHCGHTSFKMSRQWNQFIKNRNIPSFPLWLKVWKDSMMVVENRNEKDSIIHRGSFIKSINGVSSADLVNILFDYMVEDGYAENVKYIRLSSAFPFFHRNVFGLYKNYSVVFSDSAGKTNSTVIPYFAQAEDSLQKIKKEIFFRKRSRSEKLNDLRSLKIDSSYALMTINSFSKAHLNSFFKHSFRLLRREHISNLVIDIRTNGGGDINKSALLTKFIRKTPFKVADSAYAVSKKFAPFSKYISNSFFNSLGLFLFTRKHADGKYHFGYWERHTYQPKRRNNFDGKVFVLTNGLTFSASTLFCNAVKGQPNVTLVGEETGGGWYGNSGILIPDIKLPNTHLRVRLPFFKLIQFNHISEKGRGVFPDVFVPPNWQDILNGLDTKLKVVQQLIVEKR
jgi:hypothetical protein